MQKNNKQFFHKLPLLKYRTLFLTIFSGLAAIGGLETLYIVLNRPGFFTLSNAAYLLISSTIVLSRLFKQISLDRAPASISYNAKYLLGLFMIAFTNTAYNYVAGVSLSVVHSLNLAAVELVLFMILSRIENEFLHDSQGEHSEQAPEIAIETATRLDMGIKQSVPEDMHVSSLQLTTAENEFLTILDRVILWQWDAVDRN